MNSRIRYRRRPSFAALELRHRSSFNEIRFQILRAFETFWLPGLIFCLPVLIYLPVLQIGFVSDDFSYHSLFKDSWNLFFRKVISLYYGDLKFPFVRPVTFISFEIDYQLWGKQAFGFHLTNILLHAINSTLLFYLFTTLGMRKVAAAIASLFFALYPGHPEAVTWIGGRFDVLCLTWLLIAMLLWCHARLSGKDFLLVPSVVSFLLAVLSKETALAAILIFPLLDWLLYLQTRFTAGQGIEFPLKWYVVLIAIVVSVLYSRVALYGNLGGYSSIYLQAYGISPSTNPWWVNLLQFDLKMLLAPVSSYLSPFWAGFGITTFRIIGVFLILGMAASIFEFYRIVETSLIRMLTGVIWIISLLIPVAGLNGVTESLDCSRFLYMPACGLAMMLGWTLDIEPKKWANSPVWNNAVIIGLIVIILGNAIILKKHNDFWIESGSIASKIHAIITANVEALPDGSVIYLINLPYLWKGAHCAPFEYQSHFEFIGSSKRIRTIRIRIEPEKIHSWWNEITANRHTTVMGFYWRDEDGNIEVLRKEIPEAQN